MDRILNVENKDTRVEFVNQFSLIAQDYLKAVNRCFCSYGIRILVEYISKG